MEDNSGDNLILVDKTGEHFIKCRDTVGYPFFGELILDCINRTEHAMTHRNMPSWPPDFVWNVRPGQNGLGSQKQRVSGLVKKRSIR